MFRLDIEVVKFIYSSCYNLGNSVGFGALEGAYMYIGVITLGILSGLSISKKGVK